MKISTSIMAHPEREQSVTRLSFELNAGRSPLDWGTIPVAWDTEGAPSRDPERIWNTARRAWELYDPSADWHLLLQDDAIVATNLLEVLPRALEYVPPACVVSLYVGTGRPLAGIWGRVCAEANEVGASWIVGPRPLWGVGLMLPTAVIPDMIAYCQTQRGVPDDMRLGRWAQRSKLETWFTWPCLVSHPEGSSLIGHGAGRTAWSFRGDARGSAWDGPVVQWKRA